MIHVNNLQFQYPKNDSPTLKGISFDIKEGELFGFLPTHWTFQAIQNITDGVSYALFVSIGVVYFGGLIIWLSKQFLKKHFV